MEFIALTAHKDIIEVGDSQQMEISYIREPFLAAVQDFIAILKKEITVNKFI